MEPIPVPKPKGVRDPKRPAGTLLLAQVRHLRKAEQALPPKYNSGIFHKAIETEDEAARYIQAVTGAIHKAHDDATRERARRADAGKKTGRTASKAARASNRSRRSRQKKATKKAQVRS